MQHNDIWQSDTQHKRHLVYQHTVFMHGVNMLNVITLNVIMLSIVMLNVIILNVVAPLGAYPAERGTAKQSSCHTRKDQTSAATFTL